MSTFGSSVRDPEREAEEVNARKAARRMDIHALYEQVMALQTKVSELQIEMGKRDGTMQMLRQRLDVLEQERLEKLMAGIGPGPSVKADA